MSRKGNSKHVSASETESSVNELRVSVGMMSEKSLVWQLMIWRIPEISRRSVSASDGKEACTSREGRKRVGIKRTEGKEERMIRSNGLIPRLRVGSEKMFAC